MPITAKEQRFPLSDDKVLIISTRKSGNYLKTYGRVERVEGAFLVHTMFKDFNRCVKTTLPGRVTQQQIDLQAASIDVEAIRAEALSFYENLETGQTV